MTINDVVTIKWYDYITISHGYQVIKSSSKSQNIFALLKSIRPHYLALISSIKIEKKKETQSTNDCAPKHTVMRNCCCKYNLLKISRLLSHADMWTIERSWTFHHVTQLLRNTTKIINKLSFSFVSRCSHVWCRSLPSPLLSPLAVFLE